MATNNTASVTLPSGEKTTGTIKEGKTYLSDGSRVPVGSVVDTGAGGVWQMTDTGGVKVPGGSSGSNPGSWIGGTKDYGSINDYKSNATYKPRYGIEDIMNNRTASQQGLAMGDLYGITYNMDDLLKVYNQATNAEYALKAKEQKMAENQYYQDLYETQNSTINALRAQRNNQIASGMSAGLAAAAESATAMGIQDAGAAGALEIANQRQLMADQIAAAYAENIVNALQDSNSLRSTIAGLDLNKYASDISFDVALASAIPLFEEINANVYGTDKGYDASIWDTIINAQNGIDQARTAAEVDKYLGELEAETSRFLGELEAETSRYSTDKEYAAQMAQIYNANRYSSGGYSGGTGYNNNNNNNDDDDGEVTPEEMSRLMNKAYGEGDQNVYIYYRNKLTGESTEDIRKAIAGDPYFPGSEANKKAKEKQAKEAEKQAKKQAKEAEKQTKPVYISPFVPTYPH